jgi:type IV fimbrial biogenesis protein FimT
MSDYRGRLNKGFTLVELMTTLTVAMLLLSVGIPSASSLLANNRMTARTNDLVTHLQYARSESIKRQIAVTVCASEDGEVCAGSDDWGTGWIVFTDETGNVGELDGSDMLLRSYLTSDTVIEIGSNMEYVRYNPGGSIGI